MLIDFFCLSDEVENFRGFRVFKFGLYAEIDNLESSEIFARLVKLSEIVLCKEVLIFRGY